MAEPLEVRVLDGRQAVFGEQHAAINKDMSNLGVTYQCLGRLEGSRALMERATSLSKEVYGPRSVETATSLSDLSSPLCDKVEFQEAVQLAEQALALRRVSRI